MRGVRGAVELLGEKHVLGNLDRVLQQPMDEYDVDPDELALLPDGLGGDLADMRDELQLQVVRLGATVARAQVGRDILPLEVERPVHGRGGLESQGDRCVNVQRVGLTREKGCVTFDLDQIEVGHGIDHLLQQPRGVHLGMRKAHAMESHVLGVAADVSDQEEGTPRRHARPYQHPDT